MLSYPRPEDRGFYLGVWSAMRSSGSVIGGAINFSTNSSRSSGGGVAWATYLIFVGFECTGLIWALLLSKTAKVQRRDGNRVFIAERHTWKQEFRALGSYLRQSKVCYTCGLSSYHSADTVTDLACVTSSLQLLLLWRDHGYLPLLAFLSPSTRSLFASHP